MIGRSQGYPIFESDLLRQIAPLLAEAELP